MTVPLSDTRLTSAEVRLAQYREQSTWSNATYGSGAEKALHEIATGLKEEIDRLRLFGEQQHAERGVELENLRASWRDVRELLIRGASASDVLNVMDRHDRAVMFAKANAARAADALGAGQ